MPLQLAHCRIASGDDCYYNFCKTAVASCYRGMYLMHAFLFVKNCFFFCTHKPLALLGKA